MDSQEHKRKLVVMDLTNDVEVTYIYPDEKRVLILYDIEDESESECDCCGMCGSEYETREDTADVCLDCFESERNICHGCKGVFPSCAFMDDDGEYRGGFCKECDVEPVVVKFA
jgi:hypothetical protein